MATYALKNPTGKPSEAAFGYMVKLIGQAFAGQPQHKHTLLVEAAGFTAQQVSDTIDKLKKGLAAAEPAPVTTLANGKTIAGTYLVDGKIYKVKIGKGSGAPYLLAEDGTYLGAKKGNAPAILAKIAADGMDLAIAYGKATGVCGMCNTKLTHPKAVAAGIGPDCSMNHFGIKIY